jgi:hypothetical protein
MRPIAAFPNIDEREERLILAVRQPSTARQLSRTTGYSLEVSTWFLGKWVWGGLFFCYNIYAQRSRLYWFTDEGFWYANSIRSNVDLPLLQCDTSEMDWNLYAWVCFSQRSAIIKNLTQPLQPSALKLKARHENPHLRMSASNVRDLLPLMERRGIVRKVWIRGQVYPSYELTDLGWKLRSLLLQAEMPVEKVQERNRKRFYPMREHTDDETP